jgi:hypothetical protein
MTLIPPAASLNNTEPRKSSRFIPNLSQLKEAVTQLPDADIWPEPTYTHKIVVDHREKTLVFSRTTVRKGNQRIYRWTYEGKVLIRNRDK